MWSIRSRIWHVDRVGGGQSALVRTLPTKMPTYRAKSLVGRLLGSYIPLARCIVGQLGGGTTVVSLARFNMDKAKKRLDALGKTALCFLGAMALSSGAMAQYNFTEEFVLPWRRLIRRGIG